MDFGELRVTYVGNPQPAIRAATEVERINRQTARQAEANDRLVERSKRQLATTQTREAKRGADAFIRELERTRRAEAQGSRSGGFGGSLSSLSGGRLAFAGGGAVAGVGAIAAGFIAAARAGIEYRETVERLTKSFETLTGSASAATQHIKDLQEFAARTPFEFEDVARASQRFQNMGVAAKDVIPILTAVGNAVASAGGGSEQIDRASLAISQMSAKGKVSAEEMNQLAEAGVGGWRILEQQLGKTKGELMKMAEQGEISADVFIAAFRRQYEAGGAMQKQMETLSGATSTLKDYTKQMLGEAFTPLHAVLRDTAVELAKISTEGFNAQRGLMAAASVFRQGFNMANLGGGDNLLVALAMQQGGPQLAVAVQALLRGGQSKEKPQWGQGESWFDKPVKVPEQFQYKQKISDASIFAAQQARAEKEAEEAQRKAERDAARQTGIVENLRGTLKRLQVEYGTLYDTEARQQQMQLALSSGAEALTGEHRKEADALLKRIYLQSERNTLETTLKGIIEQSTATLRGEQTEVDKVGEALGKYFASVQKATGQSAEFDKALEGVAQRARSLAAEVDRVNEMMGFVDRMRELSDLIRDVPLTVNQPISTLAGAKGGPLDLSNVKSDRVEEWREVAEDLSDIFSNVFESIGQGWRGMWQEMLSIARNTLQEISRDLLRMVLTGEKSGSGGIIGMAANWIGSALFGSLLGGISLPHGTAFSGAGGAGAFLQPSSFVGGFASGGFIPPGKWGWTGERGPEPVFGGRMGATVLPAGKAQTVVNKTTIINYQPRVTPDSYSSRRSSRESFEALLAFAR